MSAAEAILDSDGWDKLTMSALAQAVGTRVPSLYNHVDNLAHVRRLIRLRAARDLVDLIRTAATGRTKQDALREATKAYRAYANDHPGRYASFTRIPVEPDDDEYVTEGLRAAEAIFAVITSFGVDGDHAYDALMDLWATMHGFVVLEHVGALPSNFDHDLVYAGMVDRIIDGLERQSDQAPDGAEHAEEIARARRRAARGLKSRAVEGRRGVDGPADPDDRNGLPDDSGSAAGRQEALRACGGVGGSTAR